MSMTKPVQPTTVSPSTTPLTSRPAEKVSWWQKLNPFRKQGRGTGHAAAASKPRRGFTIGTPNSNSARASSFSSGEHPSVRGSQNTHRPSWAGGPSRSMRLQGPPAHANGVSTASRPNPGRGNSGYSFLRGSAGGGDGTQHAFPDMLLRFGLTDRLELRLGWPGYVTDRVVAGRNSFINSGRTRKIIHRNNEVQSKFMVR